MGSTSAMEHNHSAGMPTSNWNHPAAGCTLPAECTSQRNARMATGCTPTAERSPAAGCLADEAEPTTDKQRSGGFYHGVSIGQAVSPHGRKHYCPTHTFEISAKLQKQR